MKQGLYYQSLNLEDQTKGSEGLIDAAKGEDFVKLMENLSAQDHEVRDQFLSEVTDLHHER